MEYVCKELIGEYKAVVQRPKLKKYIGEKDVLDTLESDPEFKYFMVDAQGSLLDDYIKWDEKNIKKPSLNFDDDDSDIPF